MFYIIGLEGCPYSEKAVELVTSKLRPGQYRIKWINYDQKEHIKQKLNRDTFPIITWKNKNGLHTMIGGSDDLQNLLDKI